jgi:hypothetical protein
VTPNRVTPSGMRGREDRRGTTAAPPPHMQLVLHDSAFTDRLAAFLLSVGQRPVVAGPQSVDVGETDSAEIEVYLRVWRVLYPDATVSLQG